VGNVGVPGLLLGGEILFYSNQYGFSANNAIAYEVSPMHKMIESFSDTYRTQQILKSTWQVLASGQIITATATECSDLFWVAETASALSPVLIFRRTPLLRSAPALLKWQRQRRIFS
jgi:hypothetical protein